MLGPLTCGKHATVEELGTQPPQNPVPPAFFGKTHHRHGFQLGRNLGEYRR